MQASGELDPETVDAGEAQDASEASSVPDHPEEEASADASQMTGFFREDESTVATSPDAPVPETLDVQPCPEFALLVVLNPEGIRHRVLVSGAMTVGGLTDLLCRDLRLRKEALTFPSLKSLSELPLDEITLSSLGLSADEGQECTLEANVRVSASPVSNSEYVMPDQIHVRFVDGTSCWLG